MTRQDRRDLNGWVRVAINTGNGALVQQHGERLAGLHGPADDTPGKQVPSDDLCNMCNRPLRKRYLRSCFWRVTGC